MINKVHKLMSDLHAILGGVVDVEQLPRVWNSTERLRKEIDIAVKEYYSYHEIEVKEDD